MQDVRSDRLCLERGELILHGMKKALYQAPTTEELYALEKRARRERALYIGALIRSLYDRAVSALTARVVRHA
jgi:hypothetical protein